MRLVKGFTDSLESVLGVGMPTTPFRLIANKHGRIVSALGPISLNSLDMSFPGCASADEILAADAALNAAGLTRGNSPAGRALDFAMRKSPRVAQWRMRKEFLSTWARSLYGGIQLGGHEPPDPRPGLLAMDVNSSYPYLATQALPRLRDAAFERGYKRNAVLIDIEGEQYDSALFSRLPSGETEYRERLSGWYVREEVDYHVAMGRVRVDGVVASCTVTHAENYLAPTIERLYDYREKFSRGSPERKVVKSAMNGLLGKFAAPVSSWRSPRRGELEELAHTRAAPVIRVGASALVNDAHMAGIYPRHANVLWTALTYARARVRLWQKFDEIAAAGGTVLWAHTDSVLAEVPRHFVPTLGTALGEWRLITPDTE